MPERDTTKHPAVNYSYAAIIKLSLNYSVDVPMSWWFDRRDSVA